ncbi:MAG: CAP domain-containing protein [Terracidiphilus sp.]
MVLFLALIAPVVLAQDGRRSSIQPEAWRIVELANQARATVGAGPLKWDAALAEAARQHCLRMAAEGQIAHQYAGELDPSGRAKQAGAHFSLMEENVAVGPDPATIHDAWMHSPHHRSNLLNPDVDRVGVALVAGRMGLYAVADYERAVSSLTQTQVESAVGGMLRSSGVSIVRDATLARAACSMDEGLPRSASGAQPRFIMRWQDADLTHLPSALEDRLATGKYSRAAVGSCPTQGQEGAFTAYRVAVLLY